MTQEDKDLLLKDLSTRLFYGVKVEYENKTCDLEYVCPMYEEVKLDIPETWTLNIEEVKLYLFPMSSMTEEQKNEHDTLVLNINFIESGRKTVVRMLFEFYLKNHIDYNGLIPKGLANDATGLNIY